MIAWAGNKRRSLPEIMRMVPCSYGAYHEPFVGSGSLFHALALEGKVVHLNDRNAGIVAIHRSVRDSPDRLCVCLQSMDTAVRRAFAGGHDTAKAFFYALRDDYNRRRHRRNPKHDPDTAVRLVTICALAFNGFYRENAAGDVNCPFRARSQKYPADLVSKADRVRNVLHPMMAKNTVHVTNDDFDIVLTAARRGDFVYLDPPYWDPRSNVKYSISPPLDAWDLQLRVARAFDVLDRRGCFVMLSNSDTSEIRRLYRRHNIQSIEIERPTHLGKRTQELIVTNYSHYEKRDVLSAD